MLTLLYHPQDTAHAASLEQQLKAAGYTIDAASHTRADSVIALLSNTALGDTAFHTQLNAALDYGQAIIPILLEVVTLPKSIEHLTPIELQAPDALDTIKATIDAAGARVSLKTHTPATRRTNTRIGLIVAGAALLMFIVGVYAVALLDIEAPIEEYNAIDTAAAATRDVLLAPTLESYLLYLPGSLEEAQVYPATVQAVPTRIRPFVAATATAVAIDQQD
jgi:hypothetical protein